MQMIAGVDECGRGCLAGPVVAAAVILSPKCTIEGLNDSKKLSPKKRARLEFQIKEQSLAWAICEVDAQTIDQLNILQASLLAMRNAIEGLKIEPNTALIDGTFIPKGLDCYAQAIVRGDGKFACISAASIIAKEYRDRLMINFDSVYPGYGFAAHKGYPTKIHLSALSRHSITPIHRLSFAPVAKTQLAKSDSGINA